MRTIALKAHFDGKQIVLDEPCDLPEHAALIVTVLPVTSECGFDAEDAWLRAAASSQAFANLAEPVEEVYTVEDGEPFNDAV